MSAMSEISQVISGLRKTAQDLLDTANDLEGMFSGAGAEGDPVDDMPVREVTKVTMEMLRALLAAKIAEGYKAEAKALLERYGIRKLSEMEPAMYEDAYLSAQAIGVEVDGDA